MASDDLLYLPATDLRAAFVTRRLSPVEVMDAILARIEALQPTVNAFVTVCADSALAGARAAERAYAQGESAPLLAGIPYSVKDLVPTAGVRTTFGSAVFADNVPQADSITVERLRLAGGILLGKTTTPAIGHKAITESLVSGITRNPWNLTRTPGGSSGGAGAAVASGQGPLAVGTDGGGSIRIPSSCCGIVGLKATLGRIPNDTAPDSFGTLTFQGPMARTVGDVALMLRAMAGPHWGDPWSLGQPPIGDIHPGDDPSIDGLSAAYFPLLGNLVVDPHVRASVEAALEVLGDLGLAVRETADVLEPGDAMWRAISYTAQDARMGAHLDATPEKIDDSLRSNIEEGRTVTARELQNALFARSRIYAAISRVFQTAGVIVTPTLAAPPPAADFGGHDEIVISGKAAGKLRAAWYAFAHPFNMTGHPAISVPCGYTPDGLPVGLQIVAPYYREDVLLRIARALEIARPWADRRPPV
jgi:aspartyl-tRNA(Asn)/glutamyl-tRNA(Gln) amidotransferase subunit A